MTKKTIIYFFFAFFIHQFCQAADDLSSSRPTSPTVETTATRTESYGQGLGIGLVLGSPSGVSGKYWIEELRAIDFGLGYYFKDYVHAYSDYLHHFPQVFGENHPELLPYVGAGLGLYVGDREHSFNDKEDSRVELYLRLPFGLEYRTPQAPLGIFADISPGVLLAPGLSVILQGGAGLRYYF